MPTLLPTSERPRGWAPWSLTVGCWIARSSTGYSTGAEKTASLKPIAEALLPTIEKEGVAAAAKQYRSLKAINSGECDFAEAIFGGLNGPGYTLLAGNKFDEGIEIFKLNTEVHPTSASAYDSLAEATWRATWKQGRDLTDRNESVAPWLSESRSEGNSGCVLCSDRRHDRPRGRRVFAQREMCLRAHLEYVT